MRSNRNKPTFVKKKYSDVLLNNRMRCQIQYGSNIEELLDDIKPFVENNRNQLIKEKEKNK
jgi:hypothetical protein